jgi:hypothetical protein
MATKLDSVPRLISSHKLFILFVLQQRLVESKSSLFGFGCAERYTLVLPPGSALSQAVNILRPAIACEGFR